MRRQGDPRLAALASSVRRERCASETLSNAPSEFSLTVHIRPLPDCVNALTSGDRILLSSALSRRERNLALAHELAHVLVRRGRCPWVRPADEERFADAFARELVAPARFLARSWTRLPLRESCEAWDIDPPTAVLQLAGLGLLPDLMRSQDGVVLCRVCGSEPRRRGCPCAEHRQLETDPLPDPDTAWEAARAAAARVRDRRADPVFERSA